MTERYRSRPYRSFLGERDEPRPSPTVPKLPLWRLQERTQTADFVDRASHLSRNIEAYRRSHEDTEVYRRPGDSVDDIYGKRSDSLEQLERELDQLQDNRRRISAEVDEVMRKYESDLPDTRAKRYEAMIPISPPSWMSREEKEHYTSLTDKEKLALIQSYESMMAEEQSDVQPMRFQILLSGIPEAKKAEIFSRLDNPVSLLGDNAKYMAWVKSLLKVPFKNHTSLPPIAGDSEAVNEYMASCTYSFEGEVYGHEKVKNEFLTMIGSWLKTGNSHQFGNVIGVTGPIGVGKTTLIKEGLSRAINRPFYFISLGGTSYSSFLQGHGYTYEGSTYGEIARGLIESKCMDPIFYFDELDKVASDGKGDEIIHALIHLTDPAQNDQFHDRYFAGIDLDVSKALFVFSYNDRDKVNPILRDRIHEIVLNDFSIEEKTDIALKYVLPKISKGMALELDTLVDFADGSIEHLVGLCEDTTGMRSLKLVLVRLLRILNLAEISDGELVLNIDRKLVSATAPYKVTKELVEELFNFCKREREHSVSNEMMYI
jgi:ATP-dependent Lon protease